MLLAYFCFDIFCNTFQMTVNLVAYVSNFDERKSQLRMYYFGFLKNSSDAFWLAVTIDRNAT